MIYVLMPAGVFFASLIVSLLGSLSENAYHAGDVRATGLLSFIQAVTQGGIAFAVIADRSVPNLIAASLAWSIGTMAGCRWKKNAA